MSNPVDQAVTAIEDILAEGRAVIDVLKGNAVSATSTLEDDAQKSIDASLEAIKKLTDKAQQHVKAAVTGK